MCTCISAAWAQMRPSSGGQAQLTSLAASWPGRWAGSWADRQAGAAGRHARQAGRQPQQRTHGHGVAVGAAGVVEGGGCREEANTNLLGSALSAHALQWKGREESTDRQCWWLGV